MNLFPLVRKVLFFATILGAVACAAQTVTIYSPVPNSTVPALHVVSDAFSSTPVWLSQIYLDGVKVYEQRVSHVDTYLDAGPGLHRIGVIAYDQTNVYFKTVVYATVDSSSPTSGPAPSPTPTPSSTGTTIANIDQMSGWQSCDACAGPDGSGPTASYSMWQYISSPSLDGQSAQFNLNPYVPYSQSLWWKQLGAQPAASHFVYDLNFYLNDANAPQALEFDVNQSVNGYKYIFGTECDIKYTHSWRVWDYNQHWVSTGVACNVPTAYTWHHLTWEFERVNGQTHFVALTLDGVKSYVNQYHTPQPIGSVQELNTAFQMDAYNSAYSVWLDKVSLTYW
jgi:hypothetical protein